MISDLFSSNSPFVKKSVSLLDSLPVNQILKMKLLMVQSLSYVAIFVYLSSAMVDKRNSFTFLRIPKVASKFTNFIQKSKNSIFRKSKDFEWGCGGKCMTQNRMLNVINENKDRSKDAAIREIVTIAQNKHSFIRKAMQAPKKKIRKIIIRIMAL